MPHRTLPFAPRATAAALLTLLAAGCAGPGGRPPPAAASVPDAVLQRTLETVPSGQAVGWSVPGTGRKGTVTPLRTFHAQVGFCREYGVTEVGPDGPGPSTHGTACRDASGIWQPAAGFRSGR